MLNRHILRLYRMFSLLGGLACLVACTPAVGDTCTSDSKCGTTLSCDLATADGYCTKTPCRPGECPVEATCIDFGAEKTYCMRICDADNGCREGLDCRSAAVCAPSSASPTSAAPCSREPVAAGASEAKSFCGVAPSP